MKFSTLATGSYTWTSATLLDAGGNALSGNGTPGINFLSIINASASDRVFTINTGAPFMVKAGTQFTFDMRTNGVATALTRIQMDSATFTSITIFGD